MQSVETINPARLSSDREREPSSKALAVMCLVVSGLALAAGLAANFLACEARTVLATDGKHYLTTVSLVTQSLRSGNLAELWGRDGGLEHLMLDGPLMAVYFAPLLAFLPHAAGPRDWPLLTIGQCLVHAAGAGLLSLVLARVMKNPLVASAGALVWGLYPPALLKTGHFMSEIPAATSLVLLVATFTAGKIAPQLLAGLVAGLITISKPVLAPAVALVAVLATLRQPHHLRFAAAVFLPFLTMLALWASVSAAVTGRVELTAQRQPVYNASKAWNWESDGWGCNPHPVLTDLACQGDGALAVVAGRWMSCPDQCLQLVPRKLTRLFALPWNDFKNSVLKVGVSGQTLWHQLLLCAGIYGLLVFLIFDQRKLEVQRRLPLEISILLLLGHLGYVLAESTARYAYTAVPFLIVLGTYGLWRTRSIEARMHHLWLVGLLMAAMCLTSLLTHAEKLSRLEDPRNLRELSHELAAGQAAVKIIDLTGVKKPRGLSHLVVIIDGDARVETADLVVNGQAIQAKPVSLNHFDEAHYRLFDQIREFAPQGGVGAEALRQWRGVEVPARLIKWGAPNIIAVRATTAGTTVYGDANTRSRFYLSPDYFSYGLVAGGLPGTYGESRIIEPVMAARSGQASCILPSADFSLRQKLKDSLRIRLMALLSPLGELGGSDHIIEKPQAERAIFKLPVARRGFNRLLWDPGSADCLRINKPIMYSAPSTAAGIKLPEVKQANATHVRLSISGQVRSNRGAGKVGVAFALVGKDQKSVVLGKTPPSLTAGNGWNTFKIDDLIPLSLVGGKAESVGMALYATPWAESQYGASRSAPDALFRNIEIAGEYVTLPSISGRRIVY